MLLTASDLTASRPKTDSLLRTVIALGAAFWVPVLVYFLDGAAYFGVLNVLNLHLETQLHMSDVAAHARTSILTGGLTLASFFLGGVIDRWGVRKSVACALALGILARVLLAVASSGSVLWVSLGLLALSAGAVQPAIYTATKHAIGEGPAAGLAFSLLYALNNGGQVFEGMLSPSVRARGGTPGVMWLCAALVAVSLVVHLLLYPKQRKALEFLCPPALDEQMLGRVQRNGSTEPVRTTVVKVKARHPLLDARFVFFIFALLFVRTLMAHQWLTLPQYIKRAYPADVGAHFEWVAGLNPLICLIGTPLVAIVTRRVHVVRMMIVGTAVTAGVTLLLVPGPSLGRLLAYEAIFSVGECLWSSRFLEYVAEIAPKGRVGTYQGVANLPWFIAKFTTGLYSGAMLSAFCPAGGPLRTGTLWAIYAAVGITSPLALLLASRWLRRGRAGGAL